jgi:hypothetical protein
MTVKNRQLPPLDKDAGYIPQFGISNELELLEIQYLLKTQVGLTLNTNVMRIALNMQEEKIASLLVAYYYVKIDEEMILRAVKTA